MGDVAGVVRYVWGHPANEGQRFRRLAQAATFQLRGRVLHRPSVVRIGRRASIEVALHDVGGSKAVYANPPDVPEMRVWQDRLETGDLFVDVGANVGVYSLFAADLGAEVIAIEPGRVDRLHRNVALNGFALVIVNKALSNHEGTVRFDPSGDTVAHVGGGRAEVPATTLDAILEGRTAAGVKVDVEGGERLVLEGAWESLRDRRLKCVQLEWNHASIENFGEDRTMTTKLLESFGYELYRPDVSGRLHPLVDPAIGPDVFALPPSSPALGPR